MKKNITNIINTFIVDKELSKRYTNNMETQEIDLMITENQINIDLEGKETEEEESTLIPQSLLKPINHNYIREEVLFVCVKSYNDDIVKDMPSLMLCGKKMIDWVLLAGNGCKEMTIEAKDNVLDKVRNINTDRQTIAIFYSDTPLLDRASFYRIIDNFYSRGINYLELSRGFIVKTEFLKNNTEFVQGISDKIEEEHLLRADSAKAISKIEKTIRNKINEYHMKNGVIIFGEDTVSIDCDVEIEKGAIIYPNNIIKGNSIIEEDVILNSGNIITNSIIEANSKLTNCYIENSKVGGDKKCETIIDEEK